ncbi:hypothetical protein quinque_012910 [Culex quinquefasciatus]
MIGEILSPEVFTITHFNENHGQKQQVSDGKTKKSGEMASTSSSSRINNNRHAVRSSASSAFTQRLLIGLLVCTLVLDLSCLTEARPQDDPTSVAEAIRLLQELETKHAQHARPR